MENGLTISSDQLANEFIPPVGEQALQATHLAQIISQYAETAVPGMSDIRERALMAGLLTASQRYFNYLSERDGLPPVFE